MRVLRLYVERYTRRLPGEICSYTINALVLQQAVVRSSHFQAGFREKDSRPATEGSSRLELIHVASGREECRVVPLPFRTRNGDTANHPTVAGSRRARADRIDQRHIH